MPDPVGFGKSSKPKDYQYSFSTLAHNTQLLMDSLKIGKSVIVGNSMGGMPCYPRVSTILCILVMDFAQVQKNAVGIDLICQRTTV